MTQGERSEQWRAIFKEAQAKQLDELPLSTLDSPLERAKYQVALRFFDEQKLLQTPQRLALWRADAATRRAFFDCFGFGRDDIFCLQNDFGELPPGPRNYSSFSLYERCSHLFSPLENGELTRSWNWRAATRAGMGASDLWRFDGTELVFVQTVGGWIS